WCHSLLNETHHLGSDQWSCLCSYGNAQYQDKLGIRLE
uniref:Uncharacterized protein n=1 Tax=Amphimedon queenslandica TaxID=400682 RepID=A0A1X7SSE4_AMPQE